MRYTLFAPKSANELTIDYPELDKLENFSQLSAPEQLFVYYYGVRTSPVFDIDDKRERAEKAYELTAKHYKGRIEKSRFMPEGMAERVKEAIKEVSKIKLGPRIAQLEILEQSIENIRAILSMKVDPEKLTPTALASLVLVIGRGNEQLASLVKIADGLSVSRSGDDDDDTDVTISDIM